jgi:hypothetical protein
VKQFSDFADSHREQTLRPCHQKARLDDSYAATRQRHGKPCTLMSGGGPVTIGQCCAFLLAVGFLCCLLSAPAARAQSSLGSISFQGALNGANGLALANNVYNLTFQFWNHPTGTDASNRVGGAVTVNNVPLTNGLASTAVPVDPATFDGATRYVGITVQGQNGGNELAPRVLVTAVPYALNARALGERNIVVEKDGAIGVGTDQPVSRLAPIPTPTSSPAW